MKTSAPVAGRTRSVIRCRVGEETYALDMARVRGIHRTDRLTAGRGEQGLVGTLHGAEGPVPVYSLALRLGRPVRPPAGPPAVVVIEGERRWGLLVDGVSQAAHVADEDFVALPDLVVPPGGGHFQGVVTRAPGLVLALDLDALAPGGGPGGARPARPALALPAPRLGGASQLVIFATEAAAPGRRPWRFGLSVTQVAEVTEALPTVAVPGAAEFVFGLISWRDHPVPLIDLARRAGLGRTAAGPGGRVLVATTAARDELVAFPVEASIRTQRLPVAHVPSDRALPGDDGLTLGTFELNNETVSLLDLDGVLGRAAAVTAWA